MLPFIYYIDCEGNLWVPCSCRCSGGNGYDNGNGYGRTEIVYANGRREYRERVVERRDCYPRDCCEKREFECIRPASECEKAALNKEQAQEKMLEEALETLKRLERLHENDLRHAEG